MVSIRNSSDKNVANLQHRPLSVLLKVFLLDELLHSLDDSFIKPRKKSLFKGGSVEDNSKYESYIQKFNQLHIISTLNDKQLRNSVSNQDLSFLNSEEAVVIYCVRDLSEIEKEKIANEQMKQMKLTDDNIFIHLYNFDVNHETVLAGLDLDFDEVVSIFSFENYELLLNYKSGNFRRKKVEENVRVNGLTEFNLIIKHLREFRKKTPFINPVNTSPEIRKIIETHTLVEATKKHPNKEEENTHTLAEVKKGFTPIDF